MSHSKEDLQNPGEFVPDHLKWADQQIANEIGTWNIDTWAQAGWRLDVYPASTGPCENTRVTTPTLTAGEAVWGWEMMSAEDCAALTREQYQSTILGQVPANRPRDSDKAAQADDLADQADTAMKALRDTADADLDAFDTDLSNYLPSSFAISTRLSGQASKVLSVDDVRVSSGSSNALSPADRADADAWAKNVDEGGTDAPPTEIRQRVQVPLEAHGKISIERAEFPGDQTGTHGFRYTMIYDDVDLAGVISLRIYNDAGSWLGYSINFSATEDPVVYTDVTPPGFYTPAAVERQHEEYAGAAAISGKFVIAETQQSQEAAIRWGGEHVGS